MDPLVADCGDQNEPLPVNWALKFIHNQLFKYFNFPSRFCPGSFHSTIVRKAEFRSLEKRDAYFEKCDTAIKKWREAKPQPLNQGGWDIDGKPLQEGIVDEYYSGIWLFADRDNITHYFKPNFLPPYDTPEKRKIILEFLDVEWDEGALSWRTLASNVEKALELMRLRRSENDVNKITVDPTPDNTITVGL